VVLTMEWGRWLSYASLAMSLMAKGADVKAEREPADDVAVQVLITRCAQVHNWSTVSDDGQRAHLRPCLRLPNILHTLQGAPLRAYDCRWQHLQR
jgi:hypothetical protein